MKITANTQHLMERANRALSRSGTCFTEQNVTDWLAAVRNACPRDWRFSENPQGEFLLTVVKEDEKVQLKFLGRSYRLTRNWSALWEGVTALLDSEEEPGEEAVEKLAGFYLEDQCQWDADIRHELKTILTPKMVPTSAGRLDEFESEPHMSVLTGSRLHYNLARRPNALLLLRDRSEPELLVRQGQPYFRAFDGADRSISFCVFAKLGPSGIESGKGQLWKVSGTGILFRQGAARCWPTSRPKREYMPEGFRSESYWQLPLKLDAWHSDLVFCARRSKLPHDHEVMRSLRLVSRIRETAQQLSYAT